ncbi:UbiA prenyltransferase family-domain-containing protein [Mycena latifolia]|nr:UbiA prenyltransferase family-domain-containing protein [Mycena latifolia]
MLTSSKNLTYYLDAVGGYADLIRFSKPAGTILVFMPFAYSLALSAYARNMPISEALHFLPLFALWAFIGRSMACTVNDICDRDIDGQVERTKNRPLPSGRVSVLGSKLFLVGEAIVFMGMFYRMNYAVIMVYPWMKRITNWPQAWLGIAANWGTIIAWATVNDSFDRPVLTWLMIGLFSWTMFYGKPVMTSGVKYVSHSAAPDTIYAIQDRIDDAKLGVGSSALATASNLHRFLYLCATAFAISLTAVGMFNHQGPIFFMVSVGCTFAELCSQLYLLDVDNPTSLADNLRRNSRLAYMICGGILGDYIAAKYAYF